MSKFSDTEIVSMPAAIGHSFSEDMLARHDTRMAAKAVSKLSAIADAINAAKLGLKASWWWEEGVAERVYVTRNGKKAGFIELAGEKILHRECSDETRAATRAFRVEVTR